MKVQNFLFSIERYGIIIIIALLFFGVLDPVIYFFQWAILEIIRLLLH